MRHLQLQAKWTEGKIMKLNHATPILFLPLALFLLVGFATTPSHAQNVQLDLTSTCGGSSCFNAAGLFTTGTVFLGTPGMDNGNNCTPPSPYTNCPDAYSANQLGLPSAAPYTITPGSIGIPFTFGAVNTANCGPSVSITSTCTDDVINYTTAGSVITLPPDSQTQNIYSTMIILGTAVNGSHPVNVLATYTDGSTNPFALTLSDWCGFGGNPYESIAVGGIERINATGTLNGASCNLYAYTLPLDVTKNLATVTLTASDTSGDSFVLAITLKPPSFTIAGGGANPASVGAGSTSTATITVNPQTGYPLPGETGNVTLSCSISPSIIGQPPSAATAPTCSLSPTSVSVVSGETSSPTATLTFSAAKSSQSSMAGHPRLFYACLLVPGLALTGLGFGSRKTARKKAAGLLLLIMLAVLVATPACVSTVHLGNVGTPPGQYTITITGLDQNNLTQASNPPGTTNSVVVTVSQ
jgi:hypothetical protein